MLDGELLTGEDRALTGRIWVHASSIETETGIDESDIVVVGDRPRAQPHVLERDLDLLVLANGARPDDAVLAARAGEAARRWSSHRSTPTWRRA